MIFLFGDSHANFNFKGLKYPNRNLHTNSVTMHRVGRDGKKFIDFSKKGIKNGDIVIYQFGEVDCRAHVGKQLVLGRDLETIIRELADPYISSIVENAKAYSNLKLIVCSVPPPVPHTEESLLEDHKKTNPFPVVHSNEERVLYTKTLNTRLKEKCLENNIQFFDYYSHYCTDEGLLNMELSDGIVHIAKNEKILELIDPVIKSISFKMQFL
jgi:hypothetical protein